MSRIKLVAPKDGSIQFVPFDNIWVCDYCGTTYAEAGVIGFITYDISKRKTVQGCMCCYQKAREIKAKKVEEVLENARRNKSDP